MMVEGTRLEGTRVEGTRVEGTRVEGTRVEGTRLAAFVVGSEAGALPRVAGGPRLTSATGEFLLDVDVVNEQGERLPIRIPQERALTIVLDGQELITLMTLGAAPELLVLGYLFNQRLIAEAAAIESIVVNWDLGSAAVTASVASVRSGSGVASGSQAASAEARRRGVLRAGSLPIGSRTVTGCGQGAMFHEFLSDIESIALPTPDVARVTASSLRAVLDTMRRHDDIHRAAGSVHSCAVFRGAELWAAIEDVSRHNALDTIAGWMLLHGVSGADKILFTTGRLSAEMVIKAAYSGIPIVVSRNGVTGMGQELARRLGMTLFGRAAKERFLCYVGAERFDARS
jgi:FdhD protein